MMRYLYIFLFLFFLTHFCFAKGNKKLNQGYEAFLKYDYFKAKTIFKTCNSKQINFAAAYGLATIFYRNDNPFTNIDSARIFINLAYEAYSKCHVAYRYFLINVDSLAILNLADSISLKQFNKIKNKNSIEEFDNFLKLNTLTKIALRTKVIALRDELEYNLILGVNKSDSTIAFIVKHPMSDYRRSALLLLERQIYNESTSHQSPQEWIEFIKKNPTNMMINDAYEKLFEYYRKKQNTSGLAFFVKNYPKAPQFLEAWKLLFSLSVKAFTSEELNKFLDEHPNFPLKHSILKEVELNKLVLFPYQKDEQIGFIDEKAQVIIEPQFDQATQFYEGLAVVSKNDSVYYINKENVNPFNQIYAEAYPFKNGIAAVKQNNKWFFINRQGQVISKNYEEINELSNQFYVFKQNGLYGALNQYTQMFLEAKFEKLGDFKNEAAYFISQGRYGFVTSKGSVFETTFDWLSDFDEQHIAIFKFENKFGLVTINGNKILENEYDQIIKLNDKYFMLVKNGQYGFYAIEGCFVTPIIFEYNKEKSGNFYCKDNLFKLIKKGEQAIVDINGHIEVNFGLYTEINFQSNGLILAKRKNKFGFIDKKLNLVFPFKFLMAQNFEDSVTIVKIKNEFQMLHANGKVLFTSEKPLTKYKDSYYIIEDETKTIINKRGEVIQKDVVGMQPLTDRLTIVTFSNGEIKLLKD